MLLKYIKLYKEDDNPKSQLNNKTKSNVITPTFNLFPFTFVFLLELFNIMLC